MSKYKFERETIHYQQLINSCGLAATMMLVNPTEDVYIHSLLTQLGKKLKTLFPSLGDLLSANNSLHQITAAYAILKGAKHKDLLNALKSFDALNYENLGNINYELEGRVLMGYEEPSKDLAKGLKAYLKKGKIDAKFLNEYTTMFKSDVELKLLMAMLGYKFIRFPYSVDGTGSIDFEWVDKVVETELIEDNELNNYDEILEFMLAFLSVNFMKSAVLINVGLHWVSAINLIISDTTRFPDLYYLDPQMEGEPVKLHDWKINKKIYIFQLDPLMRKKIRPSIEKLFDIHLSGFQHLQKDSEEPTEEDTSNSEEKTSRNDEVQI
ncbi:MAG: hypothetical protein ACFFCS_20890 [Candidatus Hodarchaeota archaeon]